MSLFDEQQDGQFPNSEPQLKYPLDEASKGVIRQVLEDIEKDVIRRRNRFPLTIMAGATSFTVGSDYMVLSAPSGVTIATIVGGREGQIIALEFTDSNITITDTGTGALDTVNLSDSFTSADNTILRLLHDGISWKEVSRSVAGGSTPSATARVEFATIFETAARFVHTTSGGGFTGTNTFNNLGLVQDTGATSNSFAKNRIDLHFHSNGKIYDSNPTFSWMLGFEALGASAGPEGYWGLGSITIAGAAITDTENHIGFFLESTSAAPAYSLWATQADGVTEQRSELTTIAANDTIEVICVVESGVGATYYYRKNGGALSAGVTLTGNVPAVGTAETSACCGICNGGDSVQLKTYATAFSYSRA